MIVRRIVPASSGGWRSLLFNKLGIWRSRKRVLRDECVLKRLRSELGSHSVRTVTELDWTGVKNGALLKQAAVDFDCFLIVDRNSAIPATSR